MQILKNKVLWYLSSRYLTYALQFLTSLFIAGKLGPYYLGIWGFILLLLNYFGQIHFGISNSFNILYIHNKSDTSKQNSYIANSLMLNGYLAILVVLLYLAFLLSGSSWFEKYDCDKYFIYVCIIAILQYFQQFLTFLFRVKNKLALVALCQSGIVFLNFLAVLILDGESLIYGLTLGYLLSYLIIVILAYFTGDYPKRGSFEISYTYQKEIITKGLSLFLYNSCFYFIVISVRTLISGNYPVESFGIFTFSFSMAQAVMLLIESINFIIFPKVVDKFSSPEYAEVYRMLESYRIAYITTSHLFIYIALICFPVLLWFMPKYSEGLTSLNLIALCVLMNTCSAGYSTLLISRNDEKLAAILSLGALVLNVLLSLVLIKVVHVTFDYVIMATMVTYMWYAIFVTYYGQKLLNIHSFSKALLSFFPVRMLVPYLIALGLSLYQIESLLWTPLLVFVLMNFKDLKKVIILGKTILIRPDSVDFK